MFLYFGCDCALDDAVFVLGDLTEREEAEWLGRIQMRLEIPCGEFMLMGGGMEEDFDVALQHFEPPDPNFFFFHKLKLKPGSYLVEVYAFLGSYPVNEAWEDEEASPVKEWLAATSGQEVPEWMTAFQEEGYVDSEDFDLVEHIIRLVPTDAVVPIPRIDDEVKWVGDFVMRRPSQCPQGLKRQGII